TAKDLSGLVSQIWDLVEAMPEQRKMVFELHRKHGLSYSEISEVMGIAKKTVENHMGKAFQEVREKLNPIVI
ncbi:MAG: sigma factor-like helix-turn-helix DNA-binding protein, partial [Candidatus Babeliales bacterium]